MTNDSIVIRVDQERWLQVTGDSAFLSKFYGEGQAVLVSAWGKVITPAMTAELVGLVADGTVTRKAASYVFRRMLGEPKEEIEQ